MKKFNVLFLMLALMVAVTSCKKKEVEKEEAENQTPTNNVSDLKELPNGSQTFTGNLSSGKIISDLSWAWNSSMACFVEPVKKQFQGNHVLYQIDLPKNSTIDIYLTPKNSSDNIALYGYSKGAGSKTIPPNVTSCVSCEADPSANSGMNAPSPGNRHIYLNAINNPYSIIIGVAGVEGLTSGEYTIQIDIQS